MWILEILLVMVDLIGGVFGLDRKGRGEKQQSCAKGKNNRIKGEHQGDQNACRGTGGRCLQALSGEVVSEVLFCLVVVQPGGAVCRHVLQRKHGAT